MLQLRHLILSLTLVAASFSSHAQALQASGAQVVVPATGEVTLPNDQVRVTLMIEEQDQDKAAAASRVNQKMTQGIAIVKQKDPTAQLRTRGYFSVAIYADEPQHVSNRARPIVGWRIGQYLEVTTSDLARLSSTVAAVQGVLALNGLEFGLTPASIRKLDDALIAAAYQNLRERIEAITRAMGRTAADVVIETLDFDGAGNFVPVAPRAMMMQSAMSAPQVVTEPSFEPGESTLSMRLVGKLRIR